jgi:hypothetical protein
MGFLREDDDGSVNTLLEDVLFKDRNFVLIDESHNLRDWAERRSLHAAGRPVPRSVCSEALL